MAKQAEAPIRTAAERAAREVFETVRSAAYEAAREAVREAIRDQLGVEVPLSEISLDDRMTRAEAARRLGTTQQTIIRLEEKGAVKVDREKGGRVYVRLSQVAEAIRDSRGIAARARIRGGVSR